VDINGRCPDSRNLIAGVPMDLNEVSEIILEMVVEPNSTPQNRLVR